MAVMTMLLPPVSGRLVGHRGSRGPLVVAGICLTASCAMLSTVGATTSFTWLFGAYVVFGIGFGFVNAPITDAAVSGMPRAQAGVASAIASTSRQIGSTLGVAVVGALLTATLAGSPVRSTATATRSGWLVLTGCGVVVLCTGLVMTSGWARRTAVRTAHELNPEYLDRPVDVR
jgi:MFS family permease